MNATFLSAISGKFSRTLILGTLAPVTVFVILGILAVAPFFPARVTVFQPIETLDPGWQLVVMTLVVIVLSLILYGLNIPIIRFFEGYPWKDTWLGQIRTRRYQDQYDELLRWRGEIASLSELLLEEVEDWKAAIQIWAKDPKLPRSLPEVDWNQPVGEKREESPWPQVQRLVDREFARLEQARVLAFPHERSFILPTRLGNMIRAFEEYPAREYKMDAVTLWPRLIGVIEPAYLEAIDDAKTQMDFMLNSSVLSMLLVIVLGVLGIVYPLPAVSGGLFVLWLLLVLSLFFLAYWFYLQSIPQAGNWGEMVRGAYDLYRNTLLEKLGYKQKPRTRAEEQDLWHQIQAQMIYGRPLKETPPDYDIAAKPLISARGEPDGTLPRMTRGITTLGPQPGQVQVSIQITNVDPEVVFEKIVVSDTLPEGWYFGWNSASASQGSLVVEATTALTFTVNQLKLELNQSLTLSYTAILLPNQKKEEGDA